MCQDNTIRLVSDPQPVDAKSVDSVDYDPKASRLVTRMSRSARVRFAPHKNEILVLEVSHKFRWKS